MGPSFPRTFATLATALVAIPLLALPSKAAVVSVTSSPAKVAVASDGPASVAVTWQVVRNVVDPPQPGTISSGNVQVLIGGSPAATLPGRLTRSVAGDALSETVTLAETVAIPQALVYRAIKQRAELRLQRLFVDNLDGIGESASLLVTPSGPGSVALSIARLALSFDDEARSRVLAEGEALRAVAELGTEGVGLMSGQWEVARPSTTAGTPVFRPLTLVRQGVAGGGRSVITSPRLPTAETGLHLVRFRVLDPRLAVETPTLPYYVAPRAADAAPEALHRIIVAAPAPGEALTADTRFAWQALEGAAAYRLAFYTASKGPAAPLDPAAATPAPAATAEQPIGAPLAGVLVEGGRSEAVPTASALAQLPSGRRYLWQVSAFDAKGAVIGSTSPQEIYKP